MPSAVTAATLPDAAALDAAYRAESDAHDAAEEIARRVRRAAASDDDPAPTLAEIGAVAMWIADMRSQGELLLEQIGEISDALLAVQQRRADANMRPYVDEEHGDNA